MILYFTVSYCIKRLFANCLPVDFTGIYKENRGIVYTMWAGNIPSMFGTDGSLNMVRVVSTRRLKWYCAVYLLPWI